MEWYINRTAKSCFRTTKKKYHKFSGLIFKNTAIDKKAGMRKLYKVAFTNDRWATGLASFQKEDIQRMIDAGYIERMSKENNIKISY